MDQNESTHVNTQLPPLPQRDPRGHKGTFGMVVVIGGCAERPRRMIGAPALAALGAVRAGAGLVRLVMPEPVLNHGITICPAATGAGLSVDGDGRIVSYEAAAVLDTELPRAQAVVVGPGLGTSEGARNVVLRSIQQEDAPVVIDADGLNSLAEISELWRDFHASAVLTPHPGEYRRLADALKIDADPVGAGRSAAAQLLAQRLGCIVVLKGAGTVVTDGQRLWISDAADAVLATGGTGDVLSGVIAGLIAQFVSPPLPAPMPQPPERPLDLFAASQLGVEIHARAAAQWASRHKADGGMLPVELADCVPEAMGELGRK